MITRQKHHAPRKDFGIILLDFKGSVTCDIHQTLLFQGLVMQIVLRPVCEENFGHCPHGI